MTEVTNKGKFINGEAKAAEILAALPAKDRKRILKYISTKNSHIGRELSLKCHHFENLTQLEAEKFKQLSLHIHPKVLGIAIKGLEEDHQRKILRNLERGYAEQCYEMLTSSLENEQTMVNRARARVMEVAGGLI